MPCRLFTTYVMLPHGGSGAPPPPPPPPPPPSSQGEEEEDSDEEFLAQLPTDTEAEETGAE
jgi:hypothetical protein